MAGDEGDEARNERRRPPSEPAAERRGGDPERQGARVLLCPWRSVS